MEQERLLYPNPHMYPRIRLYDQSQNAPSKQRQVHKPAEPTGSVQTTKNTSTSPAPPRRKPKVTIISTGRCLSAELNQRGMVNCLGSVHSSTPEEYIACNAASIVKSTDSDYVGLVLMAGIINISNGERPKEVITKLEKLAGQCKIVSPVLLC